ncbi:MAG: hypothetical protein Q3961_01950, partial [Bifidobacteriaceae bacterium]|nr:hypothetical protein [Bifidobacteriaceae bacterium]
MYHRGTYSSSICQADTSSTDSPNTSVKAGTYTISTTGTESKVAINGTVNTTGITGTLIPTLRPRINIISGSRTTLEDNTFNSPAGTIETYLNNTVPTFINSTGGIIVGTTDPSKYPNSYANGTQGTILGGGTSINAGATSTGAWNYTATEQAATKIFKTVDEARTGLANMDVGDYAIAPIMIAVYAVTDTKNTDVLSNLIADAEPNVFYAYRLIKKITDTEYGFIVDDPSNDNNGTYQTFTPDTVNHSVWLNADGKIAYKGVWKSSADGIAIAAVPSVRRFAGSGIYVRNDTVTSSTLTGLLDYPALLEYYKAEAVTDSSALTLKSNALTAITTESNVYQIATNNLQTATTTDGTAASYEDYTTYYANQSSTTFENNVGKYSM